MLRVTVLRSSGGAHQRADLIDASPVLGNYTRFAFTLELNQRTWHPGNPTNNQPDSEQFTVFWLDVKIQNNGQSKTTYDINGFT